MEIQIQDWQKRTKINKSSLRRVILRLSKELDILDRELSIVLLDDPQIAELNLRYRQINGPTDVLAFSMQEGESAGFDSKMLGDIVISLDTSERQAQEAGHALEREVYILLIHGLLHLLGYDHMQESQASQMRQMEERLLGNLS